MFDLIKRYPAAFVLILLISFIVLYMIAAAIFKTILVLAILSGLLFYAKRKFFKSKDVED